MPASISRASSRTRAALQYFGSGPRPSTTPVLTPSCAAIKQAVPPVGEGEIFHRQAYDLRIAVPALLIYLVLCFGVLRSRQHAARAAREAPVPGLPGMAARPVEER